MAIKDVLITDYVHPVLLEGLDNLGYTTTYAPEMRRKEMEEVLGQFNGVVINTRCAIDRFAMVSAPALRWIARLGSGLDIIDLEAAAEKKIVVLSAPEGNAQAVAEHALGMLLSLSNKLINADRCVRDGDWLREHHRGWEVTGKTIGIIGFGNNGSAFGRLWRGWDVRVLAYDKYLHDYGQGHIEEVSLELLLNEADIISLHIPLTPETKELVDDTFLSRCKPNFVLINTSRGKNINLEAVVNALKSGYMGGACLDVFPYEPPSTGTDKFRKEFDELCQLENVVLSPHVAGWTVESKRKIAEVLVKKIADLPL